MRRRNDGAAVAMTAMLVSGMLLLSACGSADAVKTDATGATEEMAQTGQAAACVVTYYDSDGKTVLQTKEVEKGACAKEYTPEKDGSIFVGWFATPQMSHKFDFSQAVTEDTSVFAGFVTYVEDTREFAIVGSGTSPVLLESNWGAVIGDAQKMTKEESDSENVYTITLDLSEGDQFQFAMDSSWGDQRGYGYLDTIELDGMDYFENSGSLGDTGVKRSNIKCAVAGNYTFTLTTYPGEDTYETDNANYTEENREAFNINPYDTITWTYNGASENVGGDVQTDYYIKGAIVTGWEDVYSDETKFTEQDGTYTLKIDLTEGDEFMFTSMVTVGDTSNAGTEYIRYTNIGGGDDTSLSHVTEGGGENLIAAESGTYVFTYDPTEQVLTVDVE